MKAKTVSRSTLRCRDLADKYGRFAGLDEWLVTQCKRNKRARKYEAAKIRPISVETLCKRLAKKLSLAEYCQLDPDEQYALQLVIHRIQRRSNCLDETHMASSFTERALLYVEPERLSQLRKQRRQAKTDLEEAERQRIEVLSRLGIRDAKKQPPQPLQPHLIMLPVEVVARLLENGWLEKG